MEAEDEEHQEPNQEDSMNFVAPKEPQEPEQGDNMDGVEAKEKGEDDLIVWRPERSLYKGTSRVSIEQIVEEGADTMRLDRLGEPLGRE